MWLVVCQTGPDRDQRLVQDLVYRQIGFAIFRDHKRRQKCMFFKADLSLNGAHDFTKLKKGKWEKECFTQLKVCGVGEDSSVKISDANKRLIANLSKFPITQLDCLLSYLEPRKYLVCSIRRVQGWEDAVRRHEKNSACPTEEFNWKHAKKSEDREKHGQFHLASVFGCEERLPLPIEIWTVDFRCRKPGAYAEALSER